MFWHILIAGCASHVRHKPIDDSDLDENDNVVYITVKSPYDEAKLVRDTKNSSYTDNTVWLRSFNEDVLDRMLIKSMTTNCLSKFKSDTVTYRSIAKDYIKAFCSVLYVKSGQSIDLGKEKFDEMAKDIIYKNIKLNSVFDTTEFREKYISSGKCKKYQVDCKYVIEMKKILLLSYIDILNLHRDFAEDVYASKLKDMLTSLNSIDNIVCSEITNFCCETMDIELGNEGQVDRITNIERKYDKVNGQSGYNHYLIDITSIFADAMREFNFTRVKDFDGLSENTEAILIDEITRIVNLIIQAKKTCDSNSARKFTIFFDPYSLYEYLRLKIRGPDIWIAEFLKNLDGLFGKVRKQLKKQQGERKGSATTINFIDKLDILKQKVNSHEIANNIEETLDDPVFYDLKRDLAAIFGTVNEQKICISGKCSFIDLLIEKVCATKYDMTSNNPKYKQAIKRIGKGCTHCLEYVDRCSECVDFLRKFEYIYTQIVSYCLSLEYTIGRNYFENMDELTNFVRDQKERIDLAYNKLKGKHTNTVREQYHKKRDRNRKRTSLMSNAFTNTIGTVKSGIGKIRDAVTGTANGIYGVVQGVGGGIKRMFVGSKKGLTETTSQTLDAARNIVVELQHSYTVTKSAAEKRTNETMYALRNTGRKIKKLSKPAITQSKSQALRAANGVKKGIFNAISGAQETVIQARDRTMNKLEDVKDGIVDVVTGAKEVVTRAKDRTVRSIQNTTRGVGQAINGARQAVSKKTLQTLQAARFGGKRQKESGKLTSKPAVRKTGQSSDVVRDAARRKNNGNKGANKVTASTTNRILQSIRDFGSGINWIVGSAKEKAINKILQTLHAVKNAGKRLTQFGRSTGNVETRNIDSCAKKYNPQSNEMAIERCSDETEDFLSSEDESTKQRRETAAKAICDKKLTALDKKFAESREGQGGLSEAEYKAKIDAILENYAANKIKSRRARMVSERPHG